MTMMIVIAMVMIQSEVMKILAMVMVMVFCPVVMMVIVVTMCKLVVIVIVSTGVTSANQSQLVVHDLKKLINLDGTVAVCICFTHQ